MLHDNPHSPEWLTADDLVDHGYDKDTIARLPVVHTGHDGEPCWHYEEVVDLLLHVEQER